MGRKNIIIFWGVLDFSAYFWYVGWRLFEGQIPFYYDVANSIHLSESFGSVSPIIISSISAVLYQTLLVSGFLLVKRNTRVSLLCYIQTIFRFLTLIPPSIFFLTWPWKYLFDNPKTFSVMATFGFLLLLSEGFKLYSIYSWRRALKFA
jgi:hypothetical protein